MSLVFRAPRQPSAAVHGQTARFPIRRIFCVGRNYAEHAREMGRDPDREPPFFFTKPADSIVDDGETVAYPPLTSNFHYEAELVVAIGKRGFDIKEPNALGYIYGYAVGNDLTRRDDRSAVCGPIHTVGEVGHIDQGAIRLSVGGVVKQKADIRDLIWSVPEIVAFLSQSVVIEPGDLVYTGTPAGVGPLLPGDVCVAEIEGLGSIGNPIGERG